MFQQFVLLKDLSSPILDKVLSQKELYAKCSQSDITSLPDVNINNFVNICNFIDYYQLIDDIEFIANIQYHILCKHEEVIDNIHLIPLNIQQKVHQNPCLTEMKCDKKDDPYEGYNIKHIACYKFLSRYRSINESINNAIYDGNLELVKYLFKIGKDCTGYAIDFSCYIGHLEVVKYLIEFQNKKYTQETLYVSSHNNEIVQYLKSHPDSFIN